MLDLMGGGQCMSGLDAVEFFEMLAAGEDIYDEVKTEEFCDDYERALNRLRLEVRNDSVQNNKIVALAFENAQLRSAIEQFEPDFFTRKCRVCGCDWNHPCEGGCSWVGDDLCSACFQKLMGGK